jgi:hypothetical protein
MKNRRGQAMTELVMLIPLLLMLAAGGMTILYVCWQGIKVQQAANLAARIQGQQRVAGGVSTNAIMTDNGTATGSDIDPTKDATGLDADRMAVLMNSRKVKPPTWSVYGQIVRAVRQFFNPGEQSTVFVPMPTYGAIGYSDQVKVVRVWQPPRIFGLKFRPIMLPATAYGGEDPHMYGLVRWGHTAAGGGSSSPEFWSQRDQNGNLVNLPNPKND